MVNRNKFGVLLIGWAAGLVAGCGGSGSGAGDGAEILAIGEVVARNTNGVAIRLGETVTTEGIVTVDAPIFANNKLKMFLQDGMDGVMVFHATSAAVPTFAEGERVQVTGLVRQADPTSQENRAEGTVMIDITDGSYIQLSAGNALPDPEQVTIDEIIDSGDAFVGLLVRISAVRRTAGDWPNAGSRSAEVRITDNSSSSDLTLRMQRNAISGALADRFAAIGDGAFELTGIVVQDDTDGDDTLLDGYEVWIRGVKDVAIP